MERGLLIKRMDIAIMKEGGSNKMSPSVLKTVSLKRFLTS